MTRKIAPAPSWAIVELFGHRRIAGRLSQADFPAGHIRVDVIDGSGEVIATQVYAPDAVYCITYTDEHAAKTAALFSRPEPVTAWEVGHLPVTVEDSEQFPYRQGPEPTDETRKELTF